MNCDKCIYSKFPKIPQSEIKQCDLAIVGEAPGDKEIAFGKPFIGPSGNLLADSLKQANLPKREDIFITNTLLCRPVKDSILKKEAVKNCQDRLISEIKLTNPKVVLALGNHAIHSLTDNFNLKITSVNGKVLSSPLLNGAKIIPAFHPAAILRNPGYQPFFNEALSYVKIVMDGGKLKKPPRIHYTVIDDRQTLIETLAYIRKHYKGKIIGADLETVSLSPYSGKITHIGLAIENDVVIMFEAKFLNACYQEIKDFFEDKDLLFGWQNGQFDTCYFRQYGIDARIDHDSMFLHYCKNEHEGYHDLDTLSMRELGADLYSYKIKPYISQMDKAPRWLWAPYLACDCSYEKQLIHKFLPQVYSDIQLKSLYTKIMIPAGNFLKDVQWNGFFINEAYTIKYRKEIVSEIEDLAQTIDDFFSREWDPLTYKSESRAKSAPDKFNPGSNKQLAWMIYDKLKLQPKILKDTNNGKSVDEDVLNSLKGQHEAIDILLEHRKKEKILSTYIDGVLQKMDSDKRIRSQFWLTRTVTGRTASRKPNLQNISRNTKVKDIFGSPRERVLIEADYKGVELRVLAHVSKDPFLTKIFSENRDLHNEMSLEIYGPGFTKEQRVHVKGVNFGVAYGRGPESIAEEFGMSIKEASNLIKAWYDRVPKAKEYMNKCEEYLEKGYTFLTPFGRKRRFGSIPKYLRGQEEKDKLAHMKREARNFAIQSIASDLTILAAMEIHRIVQKYDSMIVNLVHDSIIIEAPNLKYIVMELLKEIKSAMEGIPQKELNPEFSFPAEFSVGKTWGDMKEIEI